MKTAPIYMLLAVIIGFPAFSADKLEPPDLEQYLRWGPLRVRPGIELTNLGYDDNIFFNNGEQTSDLNATLTPRLDGLVLLGSMAFLEFRQRFDYRAYQEFKDLNYLNSNTQARLTVPFGNFGLFVDSGLSRTHDRPQDQQDLRPLQIRKRFSGGLIFRPSWRIEIELGATSDNFTYEDEDEILNGQSISERLDRSSTGSRLEAGYRLGGRSQLLLELRRKDIEFASPAIIAGLPVQRDTQEFRGLTGLSLEEGGRLSGTLLLGWGRIDAISPELPDLEELMGEFELIYRIGRNTRLLLEGERSPGFAVFGANSYFLDSRVDFRATHYFNRLFGIEGHGLLGRLTFPESQGLERNDDIRRYEAGILLRLSENSLGRQVVYRLTFGRYERDSSIDSFDQTQNTIGFGARVGF